MIIYVVKQGDTVNQIAQRYGIPVERIVRINQLPYPYQLAVGQALLLAYEEYTGGRKIWANGFAYPFISPWVLSQTLPYLEELSVFSYGFNTMGQIIPPVLPVEWMIKDALLYGCKPVLTITPFGPDGQFSNLLIHNVISDINIRRRLVEEIYDTVQLQEYQGVNIDFEYILAEDRFLFTEFVREVTAAMHSLGYQTTVDLAPKTSRDQQGLLYQGKDYQALGEVADRTFIMTYEWGYTYGPAMAVAPIDKVKQVLDYGVTEIPKEKITMGIPNYGYDWILPFVRGESRAQTIGNTEAVQLAIQNGAEIMYDEIAQSPYFHYVRAGRTHEVWFEDARSLLAKYRLLQSYPIYGMGCWQIMRWFSTMWVLARGDLEAVDIE